MAACAPEAIATKAAPLSIFLSMRIPLMNVGSIPDDTGVKPKIPRIGQATHYG